MNIVVPCERLQCQYLPEKGREGKNRDFATIHTGVPSSEAKRKTEREKRVIHPLCVLYSILFTGLRKSKKKSLMDSAETEAIFRGPQVKTLHLGRGPT